MKSKAPLFFVEQLIMLLVFSLAAALCLRCFALAGEVSRRSSETDSAVTLAQNAAEAVKAAEGDFHKAAELLSADTDGDTITAERGSLTLTVSRRESTEYMGLALVQVTGGGEELFSLTVSWQEVASCE